MKEILAAVQECSIRPSGWPGGELRISITASCNMRCTYCHNEGQGRFTNHSLSLDEIVRIVKGSLWRGVRSVRLTGGEALTHPDIVAICRTLKHDIRVPTLGINTNCLLFNKLLAIVEEGILDRVVVGLDRYDGTISKRSPVGVPSRVVLERIRELRNLHKTVSVSCVYDGDYENVRRLLWWCLDHDVTLNIVEVIDGAVADRTSHQYRLMFRRVVADFGLIVGFVSNVSEYYGVTLNGQRIQFFHSHCRLRECSECARLHLRISATGYAHPCLQRTDNSRFLLDEASFNLNYSAAVLELGRPPESTRDDNKCMCRGGNCVIPIPV